MDSNCVNFTSRAAPHLSVGGSMLPGGSPSSTARLQMVSAMPTCAINDAVLQLAGQERPAPTHKHRESIPMLPLASDRKANRNKQQQLTI